MMLKIILPQAAVAAIPPTRIHVWILSKCLLGMTIGIQDIMGEAQLTAATYYKTFETLLYTGKAVFYWILAIVLGVVQKKG